MYACESDVNSSASSHLVFLEKCAYENHGNNPVMYGVVFRGESS